jgi:dihydrofolate synthase / folylpolyglutamate synthase
MVHAALLAAGHHAGRYTSPHLADLTERFVIGREPVARDALESAAVSVLACADALQASGTLAAPPTFFEATTAVAFELFRRARVDTAVIEVGLGGRFDATNVVQPVATAITTIGLDHQQHLGDTEAAIAFEKAGIIKPGVACVAGVLPAPARAVVREVTAERGAPLIEADTDSRVDAALVDGRARVTITTPQASYGPVLLALRGQHQIANALVAVRLLEAASAAGVAMSPAAIAHGLANAEWPARLELLALDPAGGRHGQRVLLDAAHNVDGARALAAYLTRWHPERLPLVVGVMRDKDVDGVLAAILPCVSTVYATTPPNRRALPAAELAIRARELGAADVYVEADPDRAVERALDTADLVCVAGSIFLAGAVRDRLKQRAILP